MLAFMGSLAPLAQAGLGYLQTLGGEGTYPTALLVAACFDLTLHCVCKGHAQHLTACQIEQSQAPAKPCGVPNLNARFENLSF